MINSIRENTKGSVPLLEMFIVIIIILILSYFALGTYLKPTFLRTPAGTYLSTPTQGTSSPQTVLDAAKANLDRFNQRIDEQNKQIDKLEH